MTEPAIWNAEPHTLKKHEILRRYLEGWFPILGRTRARVLFLDAFAGPGIYSGGEPGSPIVAMTTLLEHAAFKSLSECEFEFMFLEPRPDRFEILEREVAKTLEFFKPVPPNVQVVTRNVTFDEGASEILAAIAQQRSSSAPTFAFIDPFGFSDTPLDLICRLLDFDGCEVLFTFMFNHINWFVEKESVAGHLQALFGTDGFRVAGSKQGEDRKRYLRDLFRAQLMQACGFKYVTSFEMVNQQGNTIYFLFHGTRNLRGLEVMKDALWKADPGGGIKFLDRFDGQEVLFGGATVDVTPLRSALLSNFSGREVAVEEIRDYVLTETPFNKSHWNQKVLKPLEKEGIISVATPRSRRFTFPSGTRVRFP